MRALAYPRLISVSVTSMYLQVKHQVLVKIVRTINDHDSSTVFWLSSRWKTSGSLTLSLSPTFYIGWLNCKLPHLLVLQFCLFCLPFFLIAILPFYKLWSRNNNIGSSRVWEWKSWIFDGNSKFNGYESETEAEHKEVIRLWRKSSSRTVETRHITLQVWNKLMISGNHTSATLFISFFRSFMRYLLICCAYFGSRKASYILQLEGQSILLWNICTASVSH